MEKINIAFCNEGTFIPIMSGGDYFKFNFLRFLNKHSNLMVINCTRNYKKDSYRTKSLGLNIIHLPPYKFYSDIFYLNFLLKNTQVVMFNDAVNVIQIGSKLKKIRQQVKIGYEAHNIDYVLFAELKHSSEEIKQQKMIEQRALKESDFIFVRSEMDKHNLLRLGKKFKHKIFIGRSGISDYDIRNLYNPRKRHKKILFLGHLNYAPNRKAVEHIIYHIAPKVYKFDPTIEFLIYGAGLNNAQLPEGVNVKIKGYARNLDKVMSRVDLALCPITEGSGTRIKILDYLARGIPTITTTKGIEGLENDIKKVVILADDIDRYGELIKALLSDKSRSRLGAMSKKGIRYLRTHRRWSRLIRDYLDIMEAL